MRKYGNISPYTQLEYITLYYAKKRYLKAVSLILY